MFCACRNWVFSTWEYIRRAVEDTHSFWLSIPCLVTLFGLIFLLVVFSPILSHGGSESLCIELVHLLEIEGCLQTLVSFPRSLLQMKPQTQLLFTWLMLANLTTIASATCYCHITEVTISSSVVVLDLCALFISTNKMRYSLHRGC